MKHFFAGIFFLFLSSIINAQGYDTYFSNSTVRLDYVFCGDASRQEVFLQEVSLTSEWAGRRNNLSEPPLRGNAQIRVKDPKSGKIIYSQGFSTLFQEWISTEEAKRVPRAFEVCLQLPCPKKKAKVQIVLFDSVGNEACSMSHSLDPGDILIRKRKDNGLERRAIQKGFSLSGSIDVAIVSDGYALADSSKFFADAARACDALMAHSPFDAMKDRFAFTAVFAPSADSGVSEPHKGKWLDTSLDSHFSTFYVSRYLTTSSMRKIYDALGTVPFEHVIVLVNTPVYGGGGIYNFLTVMGSDHPTFDRVLVHEFGHAFAGLADEYFYAGEQNDQYDISAEPWEPNITSLVDFASKWADMLPEGTPVPTPVDELEKRDVRRFWGSLPQSKKEELNLKVGVYEGGGYLSRGMYRPAQECRMRMNECEQFCPVCARAITRQIEYYTE